jgi:hypothetical protein
MPELPRGASTSASAFQWLKSPMTATRVALGAQTPNVTPPSGADVRAELVAQAAVGALVEPVEVFLGEKGPGPDAAWVLQPSCGGSSEASTRSGSAAGPP